MFAVAATTSGFKLGSSLMTGKGVLQGMLKQQMQHDEGGEKKWFSIFPIENDELLYGNWEDDIIWDSQVTTLL